MSQTINHELLNFIQKSPSPFHAVANIKVILDTAGFVPLEETQDWSLDRGKSYYVTRNDSSIIAFCLPSEDFNGFQITASHSDCPTFKIKERPEISVDNQYVQLNVEGYGGALYAPWFDRPLSVAGRVIVREQNRLVTKLVEIDDDLLMIPNLAIHMNRKSNEGHPYNVQKDLLPLFGLGKSQDQFTQLIARAAQTESKHLMGKDLFLYNRQNGCLWGGNKEFLSSPRLDDLQCAFASLKGLLNAQNPRNPAVYCVFDNEEVGSGTKQGAGSTFLQDVLSRISAAFSDDPAAYQKYLAGSFMISVDNAHAVHPNQPDKSDAVNRVYLNKGIVVKHSANQKYTTDAVSAAIFKAICEDHDIATQHFVNRSDLPGGSTLGNISAAHVSINTIDIGLAQLAMHSPYETAGADDTAELIKAIKAYYETAIVREAGNHYSIK